MAWFFAHLQLASGGESAGGPCLTQALRSHFLQPLPFADGESSNPSQLLAALISDSRSVLEMRSTPRFRCAEFRAPRGPARSRGARRWGLLSVPPGETALPQAWLRYLCNYLGQTLSPGGPERGPAPEHKPASRVPRLGCWTALPRGPGVHLRGIPTVPGSAGPLGAWLSRSPRGRGFLFPDEGAMNRFLHTLCSVLPTRMTGGTRKADGAEGQLGDRPGQAQR